MIMQADVGLAFFGIEPQKKNANKINMLARRFCIAPMMDWSEITIHSTRYETTCAKIAHARSTFLSLSFSRKSCRSYEAASGCTPDLPKSGHRHQGDVSNRPVSAREDNPWLSTTECQYLGDQLYRCPRLLLFSPRDRVEQVLCAPPARSGHQHW